VSDTLQKLDLEDEQLAMGLAAGGALAFVVGIIAGSRLLRLAGIGTAVAGAGLYARDVMDERNTRIEEAESGIMSELDNLDPVARAQVLKDIAQSEL
jgi:hypothetical protein